MGFSDVQRQLTKYSDFSLSLALLSSLYFYCRLFRVRWRCEINHIYSVFQNNHSLMKIIFVSQPQYETYSLLIIIFCELKFLCRCSIFQQRVMTFIVYCIKKFQCSHSCNSADLKHDDEIKMTMQTPFYFNSLMHFNSLDWVRSRSCYYSINWFDDECIEWIWVTCRIW